jgi:hypothetical protein
MFNGSVRNAVTALTPHGDSQRKITAKDAEAALGAQNLRFQTYDFRFEAAAQTLSDRANRKIVNRKS